MWYGMGYAPRLTLTFFRYNSAETPPTSLTVGFTISYTLLMSFSAQRSRFQAFSFFLTLHSD